MRTGGVLLALLCLCACTGAPITREVTTTEAERALPPIFKATNARRFSADEMRTAIKIAQVAKSADYGYSQYNPIQTGGLSAYRQREYFAGLLGPQGQELEFRRIGSCCDYETSNGLEGAGVLDAYHIWYEGLAEPLVLYITLYDEGPLFVPQGLIAR